MTTTFDITFGLILASLPTAILLGYGSEIGKALAQRTLTFAKNFRRKQHETKT